MDAKQFIESGILETYALGLATEQEAKLVAEMVARYPEVKDELNAIEISLENFDHKIAVNPPAHLKPEILSKVQGSGSDSSSSKVVSIAPAKQSNFFKYAAAVAGIVCLGSVLYTFSLNDRLQEKDKQIAALKYDSAWMMANMSAADSVANVLSEQNLALVNEVTLLKKPGMKSIMLGGMDVAPDAKAMVYANTTTGDSYLEIMNLPAAPEGMQYQFWGIVDGKPVDAGMIPLEGDTAGIHPMKTVPNAVAYAISLEPKGGSTQPQGKIYVMGNS